MKGRPSQSPEFLILLLPSCPHPLQILRLQTRATKQLFKTFFQVLRQAQKATYQSGF